MAPEQSGVLIVYRKLHYPEEEVVDGWSNKIQLAGWRPSYMGRGDCAKLMVGGWRGCSKGEYRALKGQTTKYPTFLVPGSPGRSINNKLCHMQPHTARTPGWLYSGIIIFRPFFVLVFLSFPVVVPGHVQKIKIIYTTQSAMELRVVGGKMSPKGRENSLDSERCGTQRVVDGWR